MKVVNTVAEYIDYFRQLADAIPGINGFVWGSNDMIISKNRTDLDLPVLWLETPEISWMFKADLVEKLDTAFVILSSTEDDEWKVKEYALDKTAELTKLVMQKIKGDAEENIIEVELNAAKSFPIETTGQNGDKGWRTQNINFVLHSEKCFDERVNQSSCPLGTLPRFSWENRNNGDFNALTITQSSLPNTTPWTYEWRWQIDNGPSTTSTETPTINGEGKCIYLQLKITFGSCVRYASAEIQNTVNDGQSVPFQLKKFKD